MLTIEQLESMVNELAVEVSQLRLNIALAEDRGIEEPRNEYMPPEEIFYTGPSWPGYAYVGGQRFYDAELTDNTTGTAITDNSSGAKTWIVVNVSETFATSYTVTYETGPPPHPLPDNQEWYETAKQIVPIHLDRL